MEPDVVSVRDFKQLQEELPFLIFVPKKFEVEDVTYRKEGRKWATLRYTCKVGGEHLRVKQFFLDWFYQGFPKSLMDSFVSSYGLVTSSTNEGRVIFYGKDYKGKEASSSFALGTQIELEGETEERVIELSEDLSPQYLSERFKNYPFYKRSFFARGGVSNWFEEERISRMKWGRPSRKMCVGELCTDSIGVFRRRGEIVESIIVLSDDYYRKAVWIDRADLNSSESHLYYELREVGNFFDSFIETEPKVAFRKSDGPAIVQSLNRSKIRTMSFSPTFSLENIGKLIPALTKVEEELEKFI